MATFGHHEVAKLDSTNILTAPLTITRTKIKSMTIMYKLHS